MSAISDDTAALVAAQLTVALMARLGPATLRSGYTQHDAEADILKAYMRYKGAARETTIHSQPPK